MKNSNKPAAEPLDLGRTKIHSLDAGVGNAVLILQSTLENSALSEQLARHFRVITFEIQGAHDPRSIAKAIGQTADRLSITRYCVIGGSDLAPAAIAHAIDFGERVEALILIAPIASLATGADSSNGAAMDLRLEDIKAPTLALFGTRDEVVGCESGRIYARRIANCFYTLVYDAGHDIAADRPQALFRVVRDFLEYREKFVVSHESSVINP